MWHRPWEIIARVAGPVCLLAAAAHLPELLAQVPPPPAPAGRLPNAAVAADPDATTDAKTGGVFLALDYSRQSKLKQFDKLLEDGSYDEAVRRLTDLLSDPSDPTAKREAEDCFLASDGRASFKAEVQRRLAGLPDAGRAAYELQFGAVARRLLSAGVADGNFDSIEEAARRYPHTLAGQQATLLIARRMLDGGEPRAAGDCYQRLLQSPGASRFEPALSVSLAACWFRCGRAEAAQELLTNLHHRMPTATVNFGGQPQPLPKSTDDVLAWLSKVAGPSAAGTSLPIEDWMQPRGNARRNGQSTGGAPLLRERWRTTIFGDPGEQRAIEREYLANVGRKQVLLPTAHALAVQYAGANGRPADAILVRTPRHLVSIDFRTGKLLWRSSASVLAPRPAADDDGDKFPNVATGPPSNAATSMAAIQQRLWEDGLYGAISSDGVHVYAVEELGYVASGRYRAPAQWPQQRERGGAEFMTNRLVARSLAADGEVAWRVGGPQSETEPELARAFFLGPPLAFNGRLYAIAEIKREVRLVAVDPTSGKLVWQQQLLPTKVGIEQDALRRKVGATPSYAEGVLVCPTSAGSVVAVDLLTRSLRWSYHYDEQISGRQTPWGFQINGDGDEDAPVGARWQDPAAVIDGDFVVLTPPELDELICLHLSDGRRAWQRKVPRRELLFLAGVWRGAAVLIGRDHAVGLSLAQNGRETFRTPLAESASIARCFPAGHGFFSEDSYYLPLTTGELVQMDLASGTIKQRQRGRDGQPLGNLVAHRGNILSVQHRGIDCFHQLSPLRERVQRKLQDAPHDPWALTRLGEIQHEAGDAPAALVSFRRGYEQTENNPERLHAGKLLVEAVIDLLEQDFARHQAQLEQIAPLVDLLEDRGRLDRVVAAGWQRQGKVREALSVYLRLYDAEQGDDPLDRLDPRRHVRRDDWIASRLTELLATAGPAHRGFVDAAVQERFERLKPTDTLGTWRRFARLFYGHPLATTASQRIAKRLIAAGELAAAEQILAPMLLSSDRQTAGFAVAATGELLGRANRKDESAAFDERLKAEYADVVCDGEKTGRQIYDERWLWRTTMPLSPAKHRWATGRAVIAMQPGDQPQRSRQLPYDQHLFVRGRRGAAFQGVEISLDRSQHLLSAADAWGKQKFSVSLEPAVYGIEPLDAVASHARTAGHLLLLSTGRNVYAVNTLDEPQTQAKRRVLWSRTIDEEPIRNIGYGEPSDVRHTRRMELWGEVRYQATDQSGRPIGILSPVTRHGVCFQRDDELTCVDPLTGATRWIVDKLPEGCDLWGDDEFLFAAAPGGAEASVLRASDGELLGTRPVPGAAHRMTHRGRDLVVWGNLDGRMRVGRVDAWTGQYRWSHAIDPESVAHQCDDHLLAVFQPGGKFLVIDIGTGQLVVQTTLESRQTKAPESLHVIPSHDRLLVVTNHNKSTRHANDGRVEWGGGRAPLINGRVYCINRATSGMEWIMPAEIDNFGLLVHQPAEMPVLVFVRQHFDDPRDRSKTTAQVLCLDKRTGQAAARVDLPRLPAFTVHASAEPEKQTVKLQFPGQTVSVKFTNQPLAPEPPLAANEYDPRDIQNIWNKRVTAAAKSFFDLFIASEGASAVDPFEIPSE